jgi:acyl-CoA synthetase (AMP-forming)/AMP-acid ligase II
MISEEIEVGSVWDEVRSWAEREPGAPALIEPGGEWWSYATLQRLSDNVVSVLAEMGVGPADTVALLLPDGSRGLVTLLGTMRVCACAPLNPALTEEELVHVITTTLRDWIVSLGL